MSNRVSSALDAPGKARRTSSSSALKESCAKETTPIREPAGGVAVLKAEATPRRSEQAGVPPIRALRCSDGETILVSEGPSRRRASPGQRAMCATSRT
eukprot:scaffold60268_cov27-Tisochrysis_lutea.AAC.7